MFTPYSKRWNQAGVRDLVATPRTVRVAEVASNRCGPARQTAATPPVSPREVRRRGGGTCGNGCPPASPGTRTATTISRATPPRASPLLHFGALSAAEVVHLARREGSPGRWRSYGSWPGGTSTTRSWRPAPDAAHEDYRARGDRWRTDEREIAAWREGRTGYPLVDAAMRQLAHEGWMHNRGRMLVASFLTKTLYVDWRVGARHFLDLLVDGDIANNQLNWQWAAGTGTDTRPNRVLNPVVQGKRFDPHGAYVRHWVPELAGVEARFIHEPWKLQDTDRAPSGYPFPIVDLAEARTRFEQARTM